METLTHGQHLVGPSLMIFLGVGLYVNAMVNFYDLKAEAGKFGD